MNAALKICQERYDAQLPPEISESNEVTDWLEHSAERLVCGVDPGVQRKAPRTVIQRENKPKGPRLEEHLIQAGNRRQ